MVVLVVQLSLFIFSHTFRLCRLISLNFSLMLNWFCLTLLSNTYILTWQMHILFKVQNFSHLILQKGLHCSMRPWTLRKNYHFFVFSMYLSNTWRTYYVRVSCNFNFFIIKICRMNDRVFMSSRRINLNWELLLDRKNIDTSAQRHSCVEKAISWINFSLQCKEEYCVTKVVFSFFFLYFIIVSI
jgi:hypothetical protein